MKDIKKFHGTDEIICVIAEDSIGDAIALMAERRIGAIAIIGRDGRAVGIFTERDLVMRFKSIAEGRQTQEIGGVMTRNPVSVGLETTVEETVCLMTERGFRHLIVADSNGRPIGMLSMRDILDAVGRHTSGLRAS